ncbi:secreted protein [Bordetella ansorpii]|jgi:hypothetical protein|uniref:Secreted protein n=1 Tax=Bordetella ansorpii TaxID=288768 RepID=A0A157NV81_9BORD|nr:hypothetical protein [Bordetella ansorpii]SAI25227.1 secreted protein [Bordetella ansorpii]
MSTSGINPNMMVSNIDISSMDLETALMTVQSERTRLLDAQLADQIKAVQNRNDQIAKLNNVLSTLTKAQSQFNSDAKAGDTIGGWDSAKISSIEVPLNDAVQEAGLSDLGFTSRTGQRTPDAGETKDGNEGKLITGTAVFAGGTTKGEIDAAITKIKGLIDGESNSQQMDMLRLQSMSNKRNEAFDVMTNFVKKMQDSRSSIIGNMR